MTRSNEIMNDNRPNLHFVCTHDEARELIGKETEFYVGECGCRAKGPGCARSKKDVCLEFHAITAAEGKGRRKVSRGEALALVDLADEANLVARPFRDDATRLRVDGICFCCDDCCGYFQEEDKFTCDKGDLIEETDRDECTDCGGCIPVCYFGAREMDGDSLKVIRKNCFGCGLCVDACPVSCITMVDRDE
ncbi:MAG: 4Fe-4S binding protein [bacterium]